MQRWRVDGWTITRVTDPGFELVLPQDEATRVTLVVDIVWPDRPS